MRDCNPRKAIAVQQQHTVDSQAIAVQQQHTIDGQANRREHDASSLNVSKPGESRL